MKAHPSQDQLRQWLDGSLDEAESRVIEAHIEACLDVCQPLLDKMPTGAIARTRELRLTWSGRLAQDSGDLGKAAAGAVPPTSGPSVSPAARPLTETTSPAADSPRCPRGYVFVAKLGQGGMGAVVRARETALARDVAVKFVEPRFGHADPRFFTRFALEAEAMARLRHPNIVPVYAVGDDGGRPFMVMEYAEGGSLADRLRGKDPIAPREAASVCELLARAAHHAHERGVIHRDLKPSNILLAAPPEFSPRDAVPAGAARVGDKTWVPKVADFGLVKLEDAVSVAAANDVVTLAGEVWGSPGFMSPEQARGDVAAVGVRTDVHALGAILYFLLIGKSPFDAPTTARVIERVKSETPERPRKLRSSIPADLETICLKALQKAPADRYATAADLADDLRRFLEGRPIAARPFGPAERAWRWAKRHKALAATLMGLVVTLVAGTVVSLLYASRADVNANEASAKATLAAAETLRANQKTDEATEQSRRRQELLDQAGWREFAALIAQAKVAIDAGRSPDAWAALDRTRSDLRGWEYHHLVRLIRDGTWTSWGDGLNRVRALAFSRDGGQYAMVTYATFGGSAVSIYNADGTFKTVIPSATDFSRADIHCLAFSADAKALYTGGSDGRLIIWNIGDRSSAEMTRRAHPSTLMAIAVDPGGLWVASAGGDGFIRIWDARSRQLLAEWAVNTKGAFALAAGKDGMLVSGGADNTVRLWNVAARIAGGAGANAAGRRHDREQEMRGHQQPVTALGVLADGRIVSGSSGGDIRIWAAGDGRPLELMQAHVGAVMGIASAGATNRFATTGADGAVHVWFADFSRPKMSLLGHRTILTSLAMGADGAILLGASGNDDETSEMLTWRVQPRDRQTTAHYLSDAEFAVESSGEALVAVDDGTLKLHFPAVGMEFVKVQSRSPGDRVAAVARDGRVVVMGRSDGVEIARLDATGSPEPVQKLSRPEKPLIVHLSDSGRWFAIYEKERGLSYWDLRGSTPLRVSLAPFDDPPATRQSVTRPAMTLPTTQSSPLASFGAPVISNDGRFLVAAAFQGVRALDLQERKLHTAVNAEGVTGLAIGSANDIVAVGDARGTVSLYKLPDLAQVATLVGFGTVTSLDFSPDGARLAVGHSRPLTIAGATSLNIWSIAGGQNVLSMNDFAGSIRRVRFSADGRWLAVQDAMGIHLFDGTSGNGAVKLLGARGYVGKLTFVKDGRKLAASVSRGFVDFSSKPGVRLWEIATGRNQVETGTLQDASGNRLGEIKPTFHPDGIHGASPTKDGRLAIFELATGRVLRLWPAFASALEYAEYSPDGKTLACRLGGNRVGIWDADTGRSHCMLQGGMPVGGKFSFSPDGRRIAAHDSVLTSIPVWDAASGARLRQFVSPFLSLKLAVPTNDPDLVLIASTSGELALWGLKSGTVVRQFESHPMVSYSRRISTLALSPVGDRAAAAGNGVIVIHDLATARVVRKIPIGDLVRGEVREMAFAPDGRSLALAGDHGTVAVVPVP